MHAHTWRIAQDAYIPRCLDNLPFLSFRSRSIGPIASGARLYPAPPRRTACSAHSVNRTRMGLARQQRSICARLRFAVTSGWLDRPVWPR